MNYERRYNEILAAIRMLQAVNPSDEGIKHWVRHNIPELCESEGEKVKRILHSISSKMSSHLRDIFTEEEFQCFDAWSNAWLEKQGKQKHTNKEYTFTAIPRLLEMIQPSEKAKSYCQKLIDRLEQEGYSTDANIVRERLMLMNGEEVAMATMDEHMPDKVEQKFKVGDWITDGVGNLFQIIKIDNEWYYADDGDRVCFDVAHDYYHLWTINDAKDGDVLVRNHDILSICIFSHFDGIDNKFSSFLCYCGLEGEGLGQELSIDGYHDNSKNYVPATREQRDLLFQKIKEAGYEWDAENKELKQGEQKPAVDDERMYNRIYDIIHSAAFSNYEVDEDGKECGEYAKIIEWFNSLKDRVLPQPKQEWSEDDEEEFQIAIDTLIEAGQHDSAHWLKSLKPQPHWKPSEEQIELLREVQQALLGKDCHNRFVNFMYELKGLREK